MTIRSLLLASFGLLIAGTPTYARAAGLGEAQLSSHLAQPLRLEIGLLGEDTASLGAECFRLTGPGSAASDDLPWIRDAQLQPVTRAGSNAVLRVSTRYPVQHPAFMLGVEIVCAPQVRRSYTLLLAPAPEATNTEPSPPRSEAAAPAETVAPRKPSRRRSAPVPPIEADVAASGTPSAPAPSRRARPPEKARSVAADRLVLGAAGATEPELRSTLELGNASEATPAQRTQLRREQELILSIDDRIASQVELQDRLQKLEAAQQHLQEENRRLQALLLETRQPAAPAPRSWPGFDWRAIAGLILAALLLMLAWRRWRGRDRAVAEQPLVMPVVEPAAGTDFEVEPLASEDMWPEEETGPPSVRLPPRSSSQLPAGDWAPATQMPSSLGPSSLLNIDESVEEHDSAVELADIMMSFGRVQGAAETLAEFIRANPKQAVKPWVKLLEVYRAANMRTEFDALAHQLNKTFNVKAVQWADFDEVKHASESVEQLRHIVNQLVAQWGTRGCQIYLHHLLRDNRKGTRQGFPLGIVDDLLMLSGVLEIQLGPCKPTPEELAAMENGRDAPPPAAVLAPPLELPAAEPAPVPSPSPTRSALDFELAPSELPPDAAQAARFAHSAIEFNLDDDLADRSGNSVGNR